jgi:hypothetical protein
MSMVTAGSRQSLTFCGDFLRRPEIPLGLVILSNFVLLSGYRRDHASMIKAITAITGGIASLRVFATSGSARSAVRPAIRPTGAPYLKTRLFQLLGLDLLELVTMDPVGVVLFYLVQLCTGRIPLILAFLRCGFRHGSALLLALCLVVLQQTIRVASVGCDVTALGLQLLRLVCDEISRVLLIMFPLRVECIGPGSLINAIGGGAERLSGSMRMQGGVEFGHKGLLVRVGLFLFRVVSVGCSFQYTRNWTCSKAI